MSNKQLVEELHKPIIRKFKKRNVQPSFTDSIWGADLAGTQLISKFCKGFRVLLCVIDIYSKFTWVIPLKDKKGITITNAFHKSLKEPNRKSNKIWIDEDSKFYNRSIKLWLKKKCIQRGMK